MYILNHLSSNSYMFWVKMLYRKFFIMIIVLCFFSTVDNKDNPKYKMRVLGQEDCRTRQFKKGNEELLRITIKVNDKGTYYDQEFTVLKKFGPAAVTMRMYQILENDQQKLIFRMNSATCKSLIIKQILRVSQIPMDQDCNVLPVSVTLVNCSLATAWIWTRGVNGPGRYAYELETSCRDTSVGCFRFVADITKQKN